jgi:hypothetical protein
MLNEQQTQKSWSPMSGPAPNYRLTRFSPTLNGRSPMSGPALVAVAVWTERNRRERTNRASASLRSYLGDGPVITSWTVTRRPPSDEEIRFHAQLNERLLALNRERNGLGAKVRRWLFGNNR